MLNNVWKLEVRAVRFLKVNAFQVHSCKCFGSEGTGFPKASVTPPLQQWGEGFRSRGVGTLLLLQEVSWSPNTTKSQYNQPHTEVYWKREKRYRKVTAEGSAVEQNAGFI